VGTSPLPTSQTPLGPRHVAERCGLANIAHNLPLDKTSEGGCRNPLRYYRGAILTQTFVTHTVADLCDEEMEVTPRTPLPGKIWCRVHFLGLSPCGLHFPSGMTLPRNTHIGKALRSLGGNVSTDYLASRAVPAAGLVRDFYATAVAFVKTEWLALAAHAWPSCLAF
jgi:hypothetical protein